MSKHKPESWKALLDSPEDKIKFLLEPYIPTGGVVLLHGRKSLGKSPTAWNIGLSIAAGQSWCGFPTTQGTVLYVETDTPKAAVVPRLKLLRESYPASIPFHALWIGAMVITNLTEPQDQALRDAHAKLCPNLVIWNTTRRTAMGLDFNKGEVPSAVYEAARDLFPQSAHLFIHHDRKLQREATSETEKEDMAGNLAFANDAQVVLHLSRYGHDSSIVKLEHTGSQVSALHPQLLLRVWEDGSHISSVAQERQDDALRVLATLPPEASPKEQNLALMKALSISYRTAERRRAECSANGGMAES